jgi:hypothetical protein
MEKVPMVKSIRGPMKRHVAKRTGIGMDEFMKEITF